MCLKYETIEHLRDKALNRLLEIHWPILRAMAAVLKQTAYPERTLTEAKCRSSTTDDVKLFARIYH